MMSPSFFRLPANISVAKLNILLISKGMCIFNVFLKKRINPKTTMLFKVTKRQTNGEMEIEMDGEMDGEIEK